MSNYVLPNGPKGLPVLGSALPFFKDILGFLDSTAKTYGDIAFFRLGRRKIYMLNHPDDIQDVLITNNTNFVKSRALQRAKLVVGEGLLTSEGDVHLENRRTLQPVFHNRVIPEYAKIMVGIASEFTDKWLENKVMDVHRNLMAMTQQIIVQTLFGTKLEESSKLIDSLSFILNQFPRFLFPFSEYIDRLPLPSNKKCNAALEFINSSILKIINERRSNPESNSDLLSILIEEGKSNSECFNDQQIRDEVITFYIAGQETTSNAICWTLYLISLHGDVEEKIKYEIDNLLKGRPPGYEDVIRLKYLGNTIKESLRIYPPAWVVTRKVVGDYKVRGYTIPTGSDIYMSQYLVHRDPRFFKEPEKFNPGRWDDPDIKNLPRFAYFPFGGGTRRCIGEPFAIMEAVLIIAVIFSKWSLKLLPGFSPGVKPLITLRPKNGLKMLPESR